MVEENPIEAAEEKDVQSADEIEIPLEFVRSPDFKLYFCNSVQFSPGGKDEIQLFFGQIIAPPSGLAPKKLRCEQSIGIAVTRDHLQKIADLLVKQTKKLEKLEQEKQSKKAK